MNTSQPNTNMLLLKEFKKGNQKAYKKLFEMYWESMYTNAKSIVMDENIAKDIVQDIWLNLWQKRAHSEIKNFEGYIFKSVRYGCYKYLRDNKFNTVQIQAIESLEFKVAPEVENQHNLVSTQLVIERSLLDLPPRCRQIFKLSRMEAASNDEIASRLGISKRSVENQMSIAIKSIRQNLTIAQSTLLSFFIFSVLSTLFL